MYSILEVIVFGCASLFFVSGIERVCAMILHVGLSLLIYRAAKSNKCGIAALAYGIHFIVDFIAVACAAVLPIYVLEAGIFALAIGTLLLSLKLNRQEAIAKRIKSLCT